MISTCSNDGSLAAGSNCRALDFTIKFEQSVLTLLPDAIFITLAALRIYSLRSESSKILKVIRPLFCLKALATAYVISTNAALLATHIKISEREGLPNTTIPSLSVQLISSMFLLPLSFLEHERTIRPSSIILLYCLAKSLFVAAILRTYTLIGMVQAHRSVFIAISASVSSYFIDLIIEFVQKDRLFKPEYQQWAPETKGSFLTRSLFLWLLPTLWRGRKTRFKLQDLSMIPSHFKAEESRTPLMKALQTGNKNSPLYLLVATIKSFGLPFFAPAIPRIVLLLATFAQPLLLNDILNFMSSKSSHAEGWAIFGGFVAVYGTMVLAIALYWEKLYGVTVKYRGALVGVIYAKTLHLASHSSRPLSTGIGSNYMSPYISFSCSYLIQLYSRSVDVERIGTGMEDFHEIWAALLALPLAFAILYSQANWAALLPLGVMTIGLGVTSYFANITGNRQTALSKKSDDRTKFIASVVNQLSPIKFFAYEGYISRKVDQLRNIEVHYLKRFYHAIIITASISNSLSTFTLFVVLGVYAAIWGHRSDGSLNVSRLFTIYSTIQLLSLPFNILGQSLPSILAAYASMKRIQEFLLFDEKPIDNREPAVVDKGDDVHLRGSFAWDKTSAPVLKDIDVRFPSGKLTICAGPVAAGKTSLLLALIGEMHAVSDVNSTVIPDVPKIGYTSQESFIMPGTLKDNILFGMPFDESYYYATVEACALDVDFSIMAQGDLTRVNDGRSLSGGQKQRIALARAVYSRAQLVILDDPFSALDGETAQFVFDRLLGKTGLLKGRTVLLVTHYVHHLPSADNIVILELGSITHRGTWAEVTRSGYKLSSLAQEAITHEGEGKTTSNELQKVEKGQAERIKEGAEDLHEVDEETNNPFLRGFQPYIFWFRNAGWGRSLASCVILLLFPTIRLSTQGYLKEWSESDGRHSARWIGGLGAFAFGMLFTLIFGFYFYAVIMTAHAGTSIHRNEIRGLLRVSIGWIQQNPAGRIINRFSQDIFELNFTFPLAFLDGSVAAWGLVGSMIIFFVTSPWLAISAPFLLAAYWLLLKFYLATSKQLQQLEAASKSPLYTVFGTTLSGLEVIRAYRAEAFFLSQNDKHLNMSQGPFHYRFASMRFLKTALAMMTFIVATGLAGTVIGLRKSTSVAFLGMALSSLTSLTIQLSQLLTNLAIVENGTVSIARLQQIAELPDEEQSEDSDKMSVAVVNKTKDIWPTKGSIVFDDVKLRYGEELQNVLKGVSFSIKPGMKVGICGRTGSGKSSTVQALFRAVSRKLIDGKILVDSVDITTLPLSLLRGSMSIVTQEPFLWHDTIRNNLDPEARQSDERVWRALEQVGMKATVAAFTGGLDGRIEDAGSFSRGERQLLCMARVLLRSRKIVVLDEATSSMDLETEERVKRVVDLEMKDCTVLAVAHRIATIIDFDLILVLEDGMIVESGTPQELLETNGRFAQLAASQGIDRTREYIS